MARRHPAPVVLKYLKFLPWSGERTGHQAHVLDQGCLRVDRIAGQHVALLRVDRGDRPDPPGRHQQAPPVEAGDHARAEDLAAEARSLSVDVKAARKP